MAKRTPAARTVEGVLIEPPIGEGGRSWKLVLHCLPWQIDAVPHDAGVPLRIEIPVRERELDRWMDRFDVGAIVRLSLARLHGPGAKPWWLGIGRLPIRRVKGSEALRAASAVIGKPLVLRDAALGRLELDRMLHWFEGKTRVAGRPCRVAITQSGVTEDRARDLRDIARARSIVQDLSARFGAIERAVVRAKLSLYNRVWRERRPALTRTAFARRIKPALFVIQAGGRSTLYFSDGGLFLGHRIEVRFGARGAISEICLSG
jgi:hypothetical protein